MKVLKDKKIYEKSGYIKSHEITIDLKEDGKGNILGDAIYTIARADALYSASAAPRDNTTILEVKSELERAIGLIKEEIKRMEICNK